VVASIAVFGDKKEGAKKNRDQLRSPRKSWSRGREGRYWIKTSEDGLPVVGSRGSEKKRDPDSKEKETKKEKYEGSLSWS